MSDFIPSPGHEVSFDPPKKRDPQARIRAIRIAASEIIIEHGASALTHRAVAKRAGVAVGTTTKYFATIDELRTSALAFLSEQLTEDMKYIEAGINRATDKVAYMAEQVHNFYGNPRNTHLDAALTYAEIFTDDIQGISRQWSENLIRVLTPHFGELRAQALSVFLEGYITTTALHGQTMDRATLETIIQGITEMPVPGAGGVEQKEENKRNNRTDNEEDE